MDNLGKLSIDQVRGIVDNEGLGYAITDYLSAEEIEDEELAVLWKKAEIILSEIGGFLSLEEDQ